MPKRLTDRTLQALKPAKAGKRYDVMDTDVRGFGVRVTDKGQRTFILIARYPGSTNPTRRALGEYPTLSLRKPARKRGLGISCSRRASIRGSSSFASKRMGSARLKRRLRRSKTGSRPARGSTSAAIAKITGK